jgi:DNA-binding protein HU-beta
MNKSDLIKDVARRTGQTLKEAGNTVDEILGAIKNGVSVDGEVKIPGFGIFKETIRKARVGRNPSTGEPLQLPEKKVVKFKPYF